MNKERKKELDALLEAEQEDEQDDKNEKEAESEEEKKQNQDEENEDKEENKEDDESKDEGDDEEKKEKEKDDKDDDEADEEKVETDKKEIKKNDKWHGKSREEVIQMYEELDSKKPSEIKNNDSKIEKKNESKKNDLPDGIEVPSDEELSQMTPKQFAEWMVSTVKNLVSETYDTRTQMRDSVTQEIRDAQKDHPLLKTSPEYRELVLSLIDTASQKGTAISLKDACEKVDGFVGKVKGDTKVSEAEKIRLKKAKAQVERGAGAPISHGEDKGAEERRLEQIFGTSGLKSPLGGLGV